MMICLYFMTMCMILSYEMCDRNTLVFLIPMFIGGIFFGVATCCYDKTITKLKKEINELRKEVKQIK